MSFLFKFIARVAVGGAALFIADRYISGFSLLPLTTPLFPEAVSEYSTLIFAAVILAFLTTFVHPILKFISMPFIWLTFGLFNVVLYIAILWTASFFVTEIQIADLWTLVLVSVIVGLANTPFESGAQSI